MEIEDVRLRFAAIVNVVYALFRILAGLLFTIIVARAVSVSELALYGIILSLASVIGSLTALWSFWASRAAARGSPEAASTGLLLTILYAIASMPLFALLSFVEASLLGYGFRVLVTGSILAPVLVMAQYATSLSNTIRPQVVGYSGFIYDVTRLLLALILVSALGYGVPGAVVSMSLSYLASGLYVYLVALRKYIFVSRPRLYLARDWLLSFKTPFSQLLYTLLIGGVVALTAPILNDERATAYLSVAAFVYQPVLSIARFGSMPLYARSLRSPSPTDLAETLRIVLLLVVFIATSAMYLARPVASIFSPVYVDASPVVASAALFASILSVANIYRFYIAGSLLDYGEEKRELTRFLAFQPVALSLFLPAATLVSQAGPQDPIIKALGVMEGLLAGSVILLAYNYYRGRVYGVQAPPIAFIAKCLLASLAPLLFFNIAGTSEVIVTDFTRQAPSLAVEVVAGFALYSATLLAIDPWARFLVARIFLSLVRSRHGSGPVRF